MKRFILVINQDKEKLRRPVNGLRPIHKVDGLWRPVDIKDTEVPHQLRNIHLADAIKECDTHDIVIQAGGCIGVWPLELCKFFNKVITFEPDPTLFKCLHKNLKSWLPTTDNIIHYLFGYVAIPQQRGLSDKWSKGDMSFRGMSNGRFETYTEGSIRLDTIDYFFPPSVMLAKKISFIQLDIEGMELKALKGGIGVIRAHRPLLQLEMNGLSECHGSSDVELEEWLHREGYIEIKRLPRNDRLFKHRSRI